MSDSEDRLPGPAAALQRDYPEVWQAYAALGEAAANSGPLIDDDRRLVKLALALGADSEGAVHSQARRALAEGLTPEALRQVAVLAITTLGFPRAMAGLSWIEDVIRERGSE